MEQKTFWTWKTGFFLLTHLSISLGKTPSSTIFCIHIPFKDRLYHSFFSFVPAKLWKWIFLLLNQVLSDLVLKAIYVVLAVPESVCRVRTMRLLPDWLRGFPLARVCMCTHACVCVSDIGLALALLWGWDVTRARAQAQIQKLGSAFWLPSLDIESYPVTGLHWLFLLAYSSFLFYHFWRIHAFQAFSAMLDFKDNAWHVAALPWGITLQLTPPAFKDRQKFILIPEI